MANIRYFLSIVTYKVKSEGAFAVLTEEKVEKLEELREFVGCAEEFRKMAKQLDMMEGILYGMDQVG